jgi:hypothetical protein
VFGILCQGFPEADDGSIAGSHALTPDGCVSYHSHITRERNRQIENVAPPRPRPPSRSRTLRDFLAEQLSRTNRVAS